MKIAICDDEAVQAQYLSSLVKKWADRSCCQVSTAIYNSAEAFWFSWSEDKNTDILLLDIQMPGQSGMELARKIRQSDENLLIIFITGYSDYISEGYDVAALHYLVKPVSEEKLSECLDKAVKRTKTEGKTLLFEYGGRSLRVRQEEVLFIEAFAHTVVVTTAHQSFEARGSIGELQSKLDRDLFIRPHRSYIVNLQFVRKIDRDRLTLDSGVQIPISRRLYTETNRAFIRFYRGE